MFFYQKFQHTPLRRAVATVSESWGEDAPQWSPAPVSYEAEMRRATPGLTRWHPMGPHLMFLGLDSLTEARYGMQLQTWAMIGQPEIPKGSWTVLQI